MGMDQRYQVNRNLQTWIERDCRPILVCSEDCLRSAPNALARIGLGPYRSGWHCWTPHVSSHSTWKDCELVSRCTERRQIDTASKTTYTGTAPDVWMCLAHPPECFFRCLTSSVSNRSTLPKAPAIPRARSRSGTFAFTNGNLTDTKFF